MSIKTQATLYICEKCGKSYTDRLVADLCCKQYQCDFCGVDLPQYHTRCDSCQKKYLFDMAQKYTPEEYVEKFQDHMLYFDDEYHADLESLLDYCNSRDIEVPTYVNGTFRVYMQVNPISCLEEAEQEADCEGLVFDGVAKKEFVDFVNQWNKKYREYCFYLDSKVVVLIPEEYRTGVHHD